MLRTIITISLLSLAGCASIHVRYQTCVMSIKTAEMECGQPQTHVDADKKALALNAIGGGVLLAWAQKVPKSGHKTIAPYIVPVPMLEDPDKDPAFAVPPAKLKRLEL
jgi:hypothetical protein